MTMGTRRCHTLVDGKKKKTFCGGGGTSCLAKQKGGGGGSRWREKKRPGDAIRPPPEGKGGLAENWRGKESARARIVPRHQKVMGRITVTRACSLKLSAKSRTAGTREEQKERVKQITNHARRKKRRAGRKGKREKGAFFWKKGGKIRKKSM